MCYGADIYQSSLIKKNSGIYFIEHMSSGKRYVGSSKCIAKRWYKHRRMLNRNEHQNPILQNYWNKYGSSDFHWSIYEETPVEDLLIREQWYMDNTNCELNVIPYADRNGTHHSEETKAKIGAASRARALSEASKRKISEATKGRIVPTEIVEESRRRHAHEFIVYDFQTDKEAGRFMNLVPAAEALETTKNGIRAVLKHRQLYFSGGKEQATKYYARYKDDPDQSVPDEKPKEFVVYDFQTDEEVGHFIDTNLAAKALSSSRGHIYKVLKGERCSFGGGVGYPPKYYARYIGNGSEKPVLSAAFSKPFIIYNVTDNTIAGHFFSTAKAVKELGVTQNMINGCLRGLAKTFCKGKYYARYIEENNATA